MKRATAHLAFLWTAALLVQAAAAQQTLLLKFKNREPGPAGQLQVELKLDSSACEFRVDDRGPFATVEKGPDRLRVYGGPLVEVGQIVHLRLVHNCTRPPTVREWLWTNPQGGRIGDRKRLKDEGLSFPSTTAQSPAGYQTVAFLTPFGRAVVLLPDGLAGGDTVSGSLAWEPAGDSERDRSRSFAQLTALGLGLGLGDLPTAARTWSYRIPPELTGSLAVSLWDTQGNLLGESAVPLVSPPASLESYRLPPFVQAGQPFQIEGPFDGDLANTRVELGGTRARLLAESPRRVVAESPGSALGEQAVVVAEQGRTTAGRVHNLSLDIARPRVPLDRGVRGTLGVEVRGLAGFDGDVAIRLVNRTAGLVYLDGGTVQTVIVRPDQRQPDGSFSFTRDLTGIDPGEIDIQVELMPPPGE